MSTCKSLAWGLAALLVLMADSASAQRTNYSSGTTTNGLFGQNTVGGSGSATGRTTGGSSSTAQSGAGAGVDTTNVALSSQSMRPTVSTTQQRGAFVGADSGDTTNARSLQATNARRTTQNNGLAQLQNLFTQGLQNINNANQQGQSQTQIRVNLKLGFAPQPVAAPRVQAFQTTITKLPGIAWVGQPQVTLEGRTAVLRGKVATEDDRELAEALALMEPDVLDVRNELQVDSSGTTAEELLPPPVPVP
jgi:hypothetical protein